MMNKFPSSPSHPPTQMIDDPELAFLRQLKGSEKPPCLVWWKNYPCPSLNCLCPRPSPPPPPDSTMQHPLPPCDFALSSLLQVSSSHHQCPLRLPPMSSSSSWQNFLRRGPGLFPVPLQFSAQAPLTWAPISHHWPRLWKIHRSAFSSHLPALHMVDMSHKSALSTSRITSFPGLFLNLLITSWAFTLTPPKLWTVGCLRAHSLAPSSCLYTHILLCGLIHSYEKHL